MTVERGGIILKLALPLGRARQPFYQLCSYLQQSSNHTYSEVNPTEFNGTFTQVKGLGLLLSLLGASFLSLPKWPGLWTISNGLYLFYSTNYKGITCFMLPVIMSVIFFSTLIKQCNSTLLQ